MPENHGCPNLFLIRHWSRHVKSALFWVPWLPFALPQVWPFCWWVAVGIDHFSRRVMGVAVFKRPPTFQQMAAFLRRTIRKTHATPGYIIADKGPQFWCEGFKGWCGQHDIRPRFGAVGKHGSIAVVERFIRSMKEEGMRRLLIPLRQRTFQQELSFHVAWYNEHRPHTALRGMVAELVAMVGGAKAGAATAGKPAAHATAVHHEPAVHHETLHHDAAPKASAAARKKELTHMAVHDGNGHSKAHPNPDDVIPVDSEKELSKF